MGEKIDIARNYTVFTILYYYYSIMRGVIEMSASRIDEPTVAKKDKIAEQKQTNRFFLSTDGVDRVLIESIKAFSEFKNPNNTFLTRLGEIAIIRTGVSRTLKEMQEKANQITDYFPRVGECCIEVDAVIKLVRDDEVLERVDINLETYDLQKLDELIGSKGWRIDPESIYKIYPMEEHWWATQAGIKFLRNFSNQEMSTYLKYCSEGFKNPEYHATKRKAKEALQSQLIKQEKSQILQSDLPSRTPIITKQDLISGELAEKGRLAVHCLRDMRGIYDRIDELPNIGNRREDGGSELEHKEILFKYNLYPIISATILPPARYSYGQDLHNRSSHLFLLINVDKTTIKDFGTGDIYSNYTSIGEKDRVRKNKKNRPTYRATTSSVYQRFKEDKYEKMTDKERLGILDHIQWYLYDQMGSTSYPVNEALLKIDITSVIGIGTTISKVQEHPEILLYLFISQRQIFNETGILYPMYLYNNEPVTIQYLEMTIKPNNIITVDPTTLLERMIAYYPMGLSTDFPDCKSLRESELWPFTKNNIVDLEQVKLFLSTPEKSSITDRTQQVLQEVKETNQALSKLLPPFNQADHVLGVHKQNRKGFERYIYEEINQAALESFIKTKVLDDDKISNEDQRVLHYKKGYNLQFRLKIYEKLLSNKNVVNLYNVARDLTWFSVLRERISEHVVLSVKNHTDCIKLLEAAMQEKEQPSAKSSAVIPSSFFAGKETEETPEGLRSRSDLTFSHKY